MKKMFKIMSLLALIGLLASCDTLTTLENMGNNDFLNASTLTDNPEYVVSIHQIIPYPRGLDFEREVTSFTGGKLMINSHSEIHSRNFSKVEMVPNPKNPHACDLKVTLDRRGKMIWGQLSLNYRGEQLAFIVDGIMYRQFSPRLLGETADSVIIDGPFDRNTAANIAKHSESNYKIFTPHPR